MHRPQTTFNEILSCYIDIVRSNYELIKLRFNYWL